MPNVLQDIILQIAFWISMSWLKPRDVVLMNKEHPDLAALYDLHTLRNRAHALLKLAQQNKLAHFYFRPEKMAATASFVTEVILERYPNLEIPYHSRWRHFEAGGINRIGAMKTQLNTLSLKEQGKILYELVIISVLLDAGAGSNWHYKEAGTNTLYSRSEGLALASLSLYQQGGFSTYSKEPLRVDAQALETFTEEAFNQGFQINEHNTLEGVSGRIALLNRLGQAIRQNAPYFGEEGRLGNFYTYINSLAIQKQIKASQIFKTVLHAFNTIWPTPTTLYGQSLGDVGQHQALKREISASGFIPFHKLSQWLTYSLIEPLEQAGIKVTHLDELTGLAEYRNGGLFIDMGLLELKDKTADSKPHDPNSELIVEWRALTLALLDELAKLIRENLGKSAEELPLAKILQGGTWEAGRRIAQKLRSQGTPPLQIISNGTLF
jgi:hypothetical protein